MKVTEQNHVKLFNKYYKDRGGRLRSTCDPLLISGGFKCVNWNLTCYHACNVYSIWVQTDLFSIFLKMAASRFPSASPCPFQCSSNLRIGTPDLQCQVLAMLLVFKCFFLTYFIYLLHMHTLPFFPLDYKPNINLSQTV